MGELTISQNYDRYDPEDHNTWKTLYERLDKYNRDGVCKEYRHGFSQLCLDKEHVISIPEVSERLESISGWTLVPVTGLIPTKDFFYMLIAKKYPVNITIRKPDEIEFSEQPDIFHDVCGHLPLLTNDKFIKFLTAYSIIALKYLNNERAVDFLGRFYWYTYEMGIINENGGYKAYGGAIITSSEEWINVNNSTVPKYKFDIGKIFLTPYNPYRLQNEYFVVESFDELFESLELLEGKLIEHLLLPEEDLVLRSFPINAAIGKGFNNTIGFLNDIQSRFPQAISFVAGQPDETFFDVENQVSKIGLFVQHRSQQTGESEKTVWNKIGQYGKTKGIINDLISEYLKKDEDIHAAESNILMTVGAQEAFAIIVSAICNRDEDVILTEDPSYIGLSSFTKAFEYNIAGIAINEEGIDLRELKRKIYALNGSGKRVKLLYVIPDYQNPSGSCMPIGNRLKLLEIARQYNFLIIEDSVYNSFTYAQKRNPTLKSLDRYNRVIYVGSFSKSMFPSLRVGLIAADQLIEDESGQVTPLIDEFAKIKAQLTNNTSPICQAILGGVLLQHNCSLNEWSKPKFDSYRRKRDAMVNCFNVQIKPYSDSWAHGISWNEPDGGFFIKMSLPFNIDMNDVAECAGRYKVMFCPMRYFYLQGGGENEIRLTFSNLSIGQIESGVKQLADFLKSKVSVGKTSVSKELAY
jgi:monomeric phenylalanine-4-hydroxylase